MTPVILSNRAQGVLRLHPGEMCTLEDFTPTGYQSITLTEAELGAFLRALPPETLASALAAHGYELADPLPEDPDTPVPYELSPDNPFVAGEAFVDTSVSCPLCHGSQMIDAPRGMDTGHGKMTCPACVPTAEEKAEMLAFRKERLDQLRRGAKALGADSDVYADLARACPGCAHAPCVCPQDMARLHGGDRGGV